MSYESRHFDSAFWVAIRFSVKFSPTKHTNRPKTNQSNFSRTRPEFRANQQISEEIVGLLISQRCGKKQGVNPKGFFPELRRLNVYNLAVAYTSQAHCAL